MANLHDCLRDVLNKMQSVPVHGVKLQDWRISLFQTQMITLGIKNNIGGSVYTPPAYKNAESAEIFLIWQDGRCTRTKVQKPAGGVFDWDREITSWRMASFNDPTQELFQRLQNFLKSVLQQTKSVSLWKRVRPMYLINKTNIDGATPKAQTGANITALWGENAVHTQQESM